MGTDNKILVHIDTLLDTRLGTLSLIRPEAAVQTISDDRYYFRVIDDFSAICGVDLPEFREAYAKRNMETLRASVITEVPFILRELIVKLQKEEEETPYMEGLGVEVNIWPYELDEGERYALYLAVREFIGSLTPLAIVSIHPEKLTPELVKSKYSGLILYDLNEWVKHHLETFKTVRFPRVTVLAPALFHEQVPQPEDFLSEGMRPDANPFELAEMGFIEIFALDLIDPRYFCITRPDKDPVRVVKEETDGIQGAP